MLRDLSRHTNALKSCYAITSLSYSSRYFALRAPSRVLLTVRPGLLYIIWLSAYWLTCSYPECLVIFPNMGVCSVVVRYVSRSVTTRIFRSVLLALVLRPVFMHCLYGKLLMCHLLFLLAVLAPVLLRVWKVAVMSSAVVTWMSPTCRCSCEVTEKLCPVLPIRLNELVSNCMYVAVQCVGVDVQCGSFCPFPSII
jgi:hypothetical protein